MRDPSRGAAPSRPKRDHPAGSGRASNSCGQRTKCDSIGAGLDPRFRVHAQDGPYDKLKRPLRAEIDEAAWSCLYRTVSRPFVRPESGKIAAKVINHYGDEVLRVFEV